MSSGSRSGMRLGSWVMVLGLAGAPAWAEEVAAPLAGEAQAAGLAVANGMDVAVTYTLKVDGQVVDSTDNKPPMHYVHGRRQIIPGLERQLEGLHAGESKHVTVEPAEGYGPVDPNAVIEVPRTQLPEGTEPQMGQILRGVNPDGRSFQARIKELKDQTVMLDLNRPLAGKTLEFDVTVVDIQPAAPEAPAPAAADAGSAAPAAASVDAPPAEATVPAPDAAAAQTP